MAPRLRAVAADEVVVEPETLSLSEAVESGDYLKILRAQRRDIVRSLEGEKGPALAALHRQLSMLSKEIDTLEARPEVTSAVSGGDDSFDAAAI